jgi:subtilase family serine protease
MFDAGKRKILSQAPSDITGGFMRISGMAAVTLVTALTACSGTANSVPAVQALDVQLRPTAAQLGLWPRPGPAVRVCGDVPAGFARCQAWRRTDVNGLARRDTPDGYGPSDLQTAYDLTADSKGDGSGQTVALVDAYHDPDAAQDLSEYRAEYGLPACTVASGCFAQKSFTNTTNTGWAEEESIDIEMASAICPNCKILLVEAKSPSTAGLSEAELYATAHAGYVSNSWSGNEGSTSHDGDYSASGVAITAATGDSGYNRNAQWPAILPTVIGVGGTTLTKVNPRDETAWSGAGSGCSTIYSTPAFQSGINTGCSKRAQSDASAVANPNTGVAVYDTFHQPGWEVFGGTSVATPIVAAVFALAAKPAANGPANLYAHSSDLNDIVSGSNGNCGAPLCKAGVGWDGPTGLGTPNGIAAF